MIVWVVFTEWTTGGDGGYATVQGVFRAESDARKCARETHEYNVETLHCVPWITGKTYDPAKDATLGDDAENMDWEFDIHIEQHVLAEPIK